MIIETCEKWINKNPQVFTRFSGGKKSISSHCESQFFCTFFCSISLRVVLMINENIYLIDKNESFRRLNYILNISSREYRNIPWKKREIFCLTWLDGLLGRTLNDVEANEWNLLIYIFWSVLCMLLLFSLSFSVIGRGRTSRIIFLLSRRKKFSQFHLLL